MTTNKKKIDIGFHVLVCSMLLGGALVAQSPSGALTEAEQRGKKIFLEGKSDHGADIVAVLSNVEVPASVLPCGSCHGPGGKGNSEGGVHPSDIRWETLTRSYQNTNREGRDHPPYTEKSIKKAVTLGFDPAGNVLNPTMPRYKMSMAETDDLIAYLKRLSSDQEEGITGDKIKIACLLPPGGMENELVKITADVIRARFDQVNRSGGIYGRSIEPVLYSESSGSGSILDFLGKERPFALGCSFMPAADSLLAEYLQGQKMPLCGAISENTSTGRRISRYVFHLYAGLTEQTSALLDKAGTEASGVLMVCSDTPEDREQIRRIKEFRKGNRLPVPDVYFIPAGEPVSALASDIASRKPGAVVFFSGADLSGLLHAFAKRSFLPRVFAPGSRAGKGIFSAPIAFHKKVILAYPTWADQITSQGYQLFRELQKQYELPENFQNMQMICLAATNLLIEALKTCGTELSREKLIKSIENGGDFKSGLIPVLSYGPNKRVGSTRVFLMELDLEKGSLNDLNN